MTDYVKVRMRLAPTASRKAGRAAGRAYMPHLRTSRDGEHLGVAFVDGPEWIEPGQSVEETMALIYASTGVDYSSLRPGVLVQILEGPSVVADGEVVDRWSEMGDWKTRLNGQGHR